MTKKSLSGQLNMFDFLKELDALDLHGEVEMVSLMPQISDDLPQENVLKEKAFEDDVPKEILVSKTVDIPEGAVMSRCYKNTLGEAMIAYLDYNKVYVKMPQESAFVHQFSNSKEAVDFYIEKITALSKVSGIEPV